MGLNKQLFRSKQTFMKTCLVITCSHSCEIYALAMIQLTTTTHEKRDADIASRLFDGSHATATKPSTLLTDL